MLHVTNPDLKPNYLEIKNKFLGLVKLELRNSIPQINILVSNNRQSYSRGTFFEQRSKYLNKIVSIFLIQKKGIEKLIGP